MRIKRQNTESVQNYGDFKPLSDITSSRRPYGFSTDTVSNPEAYGLNSENFSTKRRSDVDVRLYARSAAVFYLGEDSIPRVSKRFDKYKVFVGYTWGNMDESAGLGGAFSDIIIASPRDICTETYLESGSFDDFETAKKHAKYLMTKFARALLYLNKNSQHSTTSWGSILVQDYSEDWWNDSIAEIDNHLFGKYKVDPDVESFVMNYIQQKTEDNIINFMKS